MRFRVLAFLVLGALASMPAFAKCGTLFWVKQGDEERFFPSGEKVVLKAGESAFLRVFYKDGDGDPEITATEIGHPWDFGLEGYVPRNQSDVLTWRRQRQQHFNHGRIDLEVGQPGVASIGYQIYSVGNGVKVPESCAVGVVWIEVVPRGSG